MEYVNEKCLLFFFQLSCIYFFNKFSLISYLKAKKKKNQNQKQNTTKNPRIYLGLQIRITDRQNCEQNIDVTYKFVVDKMSMDGIFGLFEAVFAFLVSL